MALPQTLFKHLASCILCLCVEDWLFLCLDKLNGFCSSSHPPTHHKQSHVSEEPIFSVGFTWINSEIWSFSCFHQIWPERQVASEAEENVGKTGLIKLTQKYQASWSEDEIYSFLKIRRKRMEEAKEEIKAFGIEQSGHQEAQLNFHYTLIITIKGEGICHPRIMRKNTQFELSINTPCLEALHFSTFKWQFKNKIKTWRRREDMPLGEKKQENKDLCIHSTWCKHLPYQELISSGKINIGVPVNGGLLQAAFITVRFE